MYKKRPRKNNNCSSHGSHCPAKFSPFFEDCYLKVSSSAERLAYYSIILSLSKHIISIGQSASLPFAQASNPSHFIKYSRANLHIHAYSSRCGLQIPQCISIFLNNISQYYCFINRKNSETCLELGGGQSPKNAEGVSGQSWQNSEMALERKRGCPLTDTREMYDNWTGEYTCECKLLILDMENLSVNKKETNQSRTSWGVVQSDQNPKHELNID